MTFRCANDLCDVASVLVHCNQDNSFMLTTEITNDYWIPWVKVSGGQSWNNAVTREMFEIFGSVSPQKMLRLHKIWVPKNTTPIYHCVFLMVIDENLKKNTKNTSGKYRGKIRWVTAEEIPKMLTSNTLKSPEIYEYFCCAKNQNVVSTYVKAEGVVYRETFLEICSDILVTDKKTNFETLVDAAKITPQMQEDILREFTWICFPAVYMDLQMFNKVVTDIGFSKEHAVNLFRAADTNDRKGISFREFLYFLAACDMDLLHTGNPAELRCRYMFRFFDTDNDNHLKYNEMKGLNLASRQLKKLPDDDASVTKDTSDLFKSLNKNETQLLTYKEFLKGIADGKIKGTTQLFRSKVNVQQYVTLITNRDSKMKKMEPSNQVIGAITKISVPPAKLLAAKSASVDSSSRTPGPRDAKNYELAVHTVRIQRSGQAINVDDMFTIENAVSSTTMKQPLKESSRKMSVDIFSQKSITNQVLKGLRYLTYINKKLVPGQKGGYSWGQLDMNTFCRNLISVANQVREVFKSEPRLIELHSPVYIMGDLHGNIVDLLYFEKILWHVGPGLCPCNLLFLGDYVDRGAYSLEVVSYLFSYKLQSPKKITLLRGNHETRDIQKMFTFYGECLLKAGDRIGNELWNAINNAFDMMPLAALIDGKVFCCHGGIPPPWLCPVISAINEIPIPLSQPEAQSSLAWELMWNDPVRAKSMDENVAMELLANEGFAVNTRRGTAHVFSVEALERFLKANQLTHLVRAHEVVQAGFSVQQKGKLLNVFSSSKYCGGTNEAACILADQGKLRILRLETDL